MEFNQKEKISDNDLEGSNGNNDSEILHHNLQSNKEFKDSVDVSAKNVVKDPWTEENWKEKMAEHPIFAPFLQENKSDAELPITDLSEGLAQLKYSTEHNTPVEVAENYNKEGIFYFKCKKYEKAIISFTEGIKVKCEKKDLNAQLYNNRSASNFYLENYRSSLLDCYKAIELKPDYTKAIKRAIECTQKLQSWDVMLDLITKSADLGMDEYLLEKRKIAQAECDKLKEQAESNKILINAIKYRVIHIITEDDENEDPSYIVRYLQPLHPLLKDAMVHFNSMMALEWPVIFQYPEYNEVDLIQEFNEMSRFIDHFEAMFGNDAPPVTWDSEGKYKPDNLIIHHSMLKSGGLKSVTSTAALINVYCTRGLQVENGTLIFIILVKGSKFAEEYLKQRTIVS